MRRAAWIAGLLLLSACVQPAPIRRPPLDADVPESWSAAPEGASAEEVRDAWWNDFGDPGLDEVVPAALEANHDLRAAAARIGQAEAQARIAGADLKPAVGFNASGSRRKQNFVGFPLPGGEKVLSTTATTLGTSLEISWEADLWGRLRAQARAAVAELQAVEADYAGARLSLAGQTVKTWLFAAEANQQVELSRRTVDTWRRSAEQVRSRYEQGVRSPLDLRLSLSSLANAESLLELRLRQQDLAIRQLEVLLGRYPGRELPDPESMPPLPTEIPAGLPADLIARRPDLAAAERRLAAADQRLLVAKRSLYPRFSLTASGGTVSNELGDLVDGNFSVWGLIANLMQPIFQGGRLRAAVAGADAGTDAALESYVAAALQAYSEVESALAADSYLAREDERLEESARQAAAARQLAQERYGAGLEDYVTVLESQRRELAAESSALAVRRQRLENRVDLYLALGGGFHRAPATGTDGTTRSVAAAGSPGAVGEQGP